MWSRGKGLLGTRSLAQGDGLLIEPCQSIHSFWMQYVFDALFLDKQGRVVHVMSRMKPNRISRHVFAAREGRGASAWHPDRVPPDFLATQLAAIVGFEIAVERWEGKVKLNQNRSPQDRAGVIARFEGDGSDDTRALAAMMRARLDR